MNVLRAASTSGSKYTATERSNAMANYLKNEQKGTKINVNAAPFISHKMETPGYQTKVVGSKSNKATRSKSDELTHTDLPQPPPHLKHHPPDTKSRAITHNDQICHGTGFNTKDSAGHGEQTNVFDIMKRQNEITTLLIKQHQRSFLPKRDIQIFDGDPLQFYTFMRAFENAVESKADSFSDCLYFLEQFTRGRPRDLVRSCQHMEPLRGYAEAKTLL